MNKVWVITQGDSEIFCSVWLTRKLAWREAMRVARANRNDMPESITKRRFKYPPEKTHLMLQYRSISEKWINAEVWYITEITVQGDVVTALADVIE